MKRIDQEENDARWLGDAPEKANPEALTAAMDAIYRSGPTLEATKEAIIQTRAAVDELNRKLVFYDAIPETPVGPVFLAVSARGLVAVNMNIAEEEFRMAVFEACQVHPERDPEKTRLPRTQLEEYLLGRREFFDLPLDLDALSPFQRQVLLTTIRIPRGNVANYHEIARRIGKPNASQAVGQALGRNPIPIVIPCHRVIASDGSLGGYSGGGGTETKARLLAIEGAILS